MPKKKSKSDKAMDALKRSLGDDIFPDISRDIWHTGWTSFDELVGGGLRHGTIMEIIGKPESGKTTAGLQLLGNYLHDHPDAKALIVDAEHTMDPIWASKLGVDWKDSDNIYYSRPKHLEQAFIVIFKMLRTQEIKFLLIDSVHALRPKKEVESNEPITEVALQARLLGPCIAKLPHYLNKSDTICICLNHISEKIGMFGGITSPGGRGLKHYAVNRLSFWRKKPQYLEDDNACSVKMSLIRSKLSHIQEGSVRYDLMPNQGFVPELEVIDLAKDLDLLSRGGAWYTFTLPNGDEEKIQGKKNLAEFILLHPKLQDHIYEKYAEEKN